MKLDLSSYESTAGVPRGRFPMRLTSARLRKTKAGDDALSVEFSIIGDKHKGYRVFESFNIFNKSEAAQRIAREKLVNLLESLELDKTLDLSDLQILLNKFVVGKLKQDGEYAKVVAYERYTEPETNEVW